jgi:hypothetical protein
MSPINKRIYRRRNPVKIVLSVLGIIIAAAILLFILIFAGFKKYAVYTDDGVTVEVPWLEDVRGTDGETN